MVYLRKSDDAENAMILVLQHSHHQQSFNGILASPVSRSPPAGAADCNICVVSFGGSHRLHCLK